MIENWKVLIVVISEDISARELQVINPTAQAVFTREERRVRRPSCSKRPYGGGRGTARVNGNQVPIIGRVRVKGRRTVTGPGGVLHEGRRGRCSEVNVVRSDTGLLEPQIRAGVRETPVAPCVGEKTVTGPGGAVATNTHAAPMDALQHTWLSPGPPRTAVLASPDSATEKPSPAFPIGPVPTSLLPGWVHTAPDRVYTHAAPTPPG